MTSAPIADNVADQSSRNQKFLSYFVNNEIIYIRYISRIENVVFHSWANFLHNINYSLVKLCFDKTIKSIAKKLPVLILN